ncbi:MAG: YCF48-related protein [Candidatus Zhuqueibacterota bacterium]
MNTKRSLFLLCLFLCTSTQIILSGEKHSINGIPETQIVFEFSATVKPTGESRELAVAFHSITFIDAIGHSLGEFIFGLDETNSLQRGGWFQNEVDQEIGSFQWSGGSQKKAEIQLMTPYGTEGILLGIKSVKDNLWMNVKIDGELSAALRVDKYWHQGYVPVGEAIPESKPTTEPVWIDGQYFPQFPETHQVFAFQLNDAFSIDHPEIRVNDWRISDSHDAMMELTIVGMQGIINRNQPKIYLDWSEIDGHHAFWQEKIGEHIEVIPFEMDGLSVVNFLMRRYSNRFDGAVIYDPEVPETMNIATMIAGLENRMILAPQQLDLPGMPKFESVYDIRELVQQFNWDASIESQTEIYQWVYDFLWQRLEHRMIGFLSPGPPTSRIVENSVYYWPLEIASRDYIIALKLPAIYLDPENNPQAKLLKTFLSEAPSPIPVTGGFALREESSTALFSEYGNFNAAFTWPGENIRATSLTVFSAVRPEIKRYQNGLNNEKILSTLGNRPVATLFCTDGDALNYLMQRGFYNFFGWENVNHQKFGWTINPVLAELAPVIWNYYIDSQPQEASCFLTGLSGAGYAYPQLMDDSELQNYLDYTSRYLQKTGLRTVRIDGRLGDMTSEIANQYYTRLKDVGYLGNIYGYGGSNRGFGFDYFGAPAPTVWPSYTIRGKNVEAIVNDILSRKPGEEFINFTQVTDPETFIIQDDLAYNGQTLFIPMNKASCCLAANSNAISLPPGDYAVTFRMKVSQNESSEIFAQIYVGQNSVNWQNIAHQFLTPAEFSEPGKYQDFTLNFTLNEFTKDIEFRLDYYQAGSDLYIDYIHSSRNQGPILPVFASILIGLIIDPDDMDFQTEAPSRFTNAFEDSGGIVLTSDEFVASLNPEYMIKLAESILTANDPLLVQAKSQFSEGDYFSSLISVRSALKPHFSDEVSISIEPNNSTITINEPCSVDVVIEDASHLGSFQFDLEYNTDIVHVDTVLIGPFLGSTGRAVSIIEPTIDNINPTGRLSFGATSSNVNDGPSGSGVLATVVFQPQHAGETIIAPKNINIGDVQNQSLRVASTNSGTIRVSASTEVWLSQYSGTSNNLYSLDAVDEQTVWIAGGENVVLRTIDGGATWTNVWGADLLDIDIIEACNSDTAFVAGLTGDWNAGTSIAYIFKTENGGSSWSKVFEQANGWITNITMFNSENGFAIGNAVNGVWTMLKTNDGGQSWMQILNAPNTSSNDEWGSRDGVIWLNESECWFTGTNYNLHHTVDGGDTWELVNPGYGKFFKVLTFNNEGIGFFSDHGQLRRTLDNGRTWNQVTLPVDGVERHIVYHENIFWLIVDNSVYQTKDNGNNWELKTIAKNSQLYSLSFVENQQGRYGWTVGENGYIAKYRNTVLEPSLKVSAETLDFSLHETEQKFKIANSGYNSLNWSVTLNESWITSISPNSGSNDAEITVTIDRSNLNPGKYSSALHITSNGGDKDVTINATKIADKWKIQSSGWTEPLYDVTAVSEQKAWACGIDGAVLLTIDGGNAWNNVWDGPDSLDILCVEAVSNDTALIAVVTGEWNSPAAISAIYITENSGVSWTKVLEQQRLFINDITMLDSQTGFAFGDPKEGQWQIFKTIDGGISWNLLTNAPLAEDAENGYHHNVCKVDENNIWFSSNKSRIIFTSDKGVNWNIKEVPVLKNISAIALNGSGIGLAASTYEKMAITFDSGTTWELLRAPEAGFIRYIYAQQDTFWALIDHALYSSKDNGDSWELETMTDDGIRNISIVHTDKGTFGWIVGGSGLISYFSRKAPVTQISKDQTIIPKNFNLWQNYPNPFNPKTNIKFDLPQTCYVVLDVFNSAGQCIERVINDSYNAGTHQVSWNAKQYSTGIYFYRIRVKDISQKRVEFADTKKFILLK